MVRRSDVFGRMVARSQIRLREVKVFDEVVLLTRRTGGWYERAPPIPTSAKLPRTCPRDSLSRKGMVNCLNDFYHIKIP
jgi:hypothetical protein